MPVEPGPRLNIKTVFLCIGISMIKIRRSWDRLIFIMGIPILVRWHLYIGSPLLSVRISMSRRWDIWCLYFWSKVNIWNVNCARATAFHFDTWMGVVVKVWNFLDRKCLDLRGIRTPNLRIHAEYFNLLSYQGQAFAVACFWILALAV